MRAIISFHAIDDRPGPLSFPAAGLRMMLEAFAESHIPVLDLATLLSPDTKSGVALTFDDGMASVRTAALPILQEHGAPAHLFLTTGSVAKDNRWPGQPQNADFHAMLDWTQIEELQAGGVLIEGHTASHPDLRTLDDAAMIAELGEADDLIERRLGRRPRYFAYPYGRFDRRVSRIASAHYDGCVTTELRMLPEKPRSDALPRLDSHYLRSSTLLHHLSGRGVRTYLSLRNLIRRVQGKT